MNHPYGGLQKHPSQPTLIPKDRNVFSSMAIQLPTQPAPPNTRKATLDEIIVAYLYKFHHIEAVPASSNTGPSAGTNAAMFLAGGPLATGINEALTRQKGGAALQEWLHYKTFAMGQPDFAAYRDSCWAKTKDAEREYAVKMMAYHKEMARPEVVAALDEQAARNRSFVQKMFVVSMGFLFTVIGILGVFDWINQSPGPSNQSESMYQQFSE